MSSRAIGLVIGLAISLAVAVAPATSHAYSSPKLFAAPAHEGGGAGRYFTGSRLDGLSCDACHGGGEALALEVSGLPSAGWEPGVTYVFDVAWSPSVEQAAVLAELSDASGVAIGELTLAPKQLLAAEDHCTSGTVAAAAFEPDDGRQVIAIGDCGAHRLRMQWRAPEDPAAGTVWLHLAGVRGDGSGDATGDGPVLDVRALEPFGATASGCQIGRLDAGKLGLGGVIMLLIAMVCGAGMIAGRRRPRATLALTLGASLVCASGCANVQPWERSRLAQPDMLIEINDDLLSGSAHAIEYREGSAGALGGAGGGCGCN
ncbi:hypothetical protein DB30_02682 [Enhygromyxa salina]|uniref:DUF4266 domain-containing protein n=1 Tax=Enhygromyxa salina TaxID=215803 RepID=A0A0C2D8G5_9BACT|nr:DUF4266 domain-containing protein [Enhygromyxa salina]KIG19401.1 hypothetical protein DB30_02682 [Enhygromyxa salina]